MPGASRAVSGLRSPLCSWISAWARSPTTPPGATCVDARGSPAIDLTGYRQSSSTSPVDTEAHSSLHAALDLADLIRTRRTQKAYHPEPVERAVLDELLDLARWAPNHNLTNPWRFRVLGPRALERLKAAAGPEAGPKLGRAPPPVAAPAPPCGPHPPPPPGGRPPPARARSPPRLA